MKEVRQTQKIFCSTAMLFAIGAALFFFAMGAKPIARGLILGTLFSIINFMLMAWGLALQLDSNRWKSFWTCLGSIWVRYFALALPMIIALKFPAFNFFATAVGVLMVQLVILGRHVGQMIAATR